ncbi:MAG: ATP-dependent RNA helicase DbpA [Pseudomonadales bacterium]|nr:ATP-dependent RNA helicase DbpA [Pseudomonadales bacterium]
MTTTTFKVLPLSPNMLENLNTLGYSQTTPIQAESLPAILQGQDVIAKAQTGSGKTAAFGIGLLERLNPRYFGCQALVLCPTRELADQVAREIRRLARAIDNVKVLTLCGGQAMGPQISSLQHGAHIIVGTPGRILKHLDKETLTLDGLNTLVLDEADRMLDMGFYDSIAEVIGQTPDNRQTLLFSATYPEGIQQLAAAFMRDPQQVEVASLHDDSVIEQRFYDLAAEQKLEALARTLFSVRPQSCVVFCFTKQQCQEVADALGRQGVAVAALHGDKEQRDRDEVLILFANRSLSVLVATDVAARGLDIDSLDLVINFELARDADTHIHRVGRTGRAGKSGLAISLVAPKESKRANAIEELQGEPLTWQTFDDIPAAKKGDWQASMTTLCIGAGRKDKLRPGDILGALTGDGGIAGDQVGKIAVTDFQAFVAVARQHADAALKKLMNGKIKGRKRRVRAL